MKILKLYCPHCGEPLTYHHDPLQKYRLHVCDKCKYSLTNSSTVDISFKSKGIAKALSNLCPYPFEFDGTKCASMESFIQSLRVKDIDMQIDVCSKSGPFCYSIRDLLGDWRETQSVYWQGKPIFREGNQYFMLLTKAYEALIEQSPIFYNALKQVKENNWELIHSVGCTTSSKTLLTPSEYIAILNHLIKNFVE